jgi:TonB family protein
MGVGPGSGSLGIQQDPEFLLYYKQVEERVKKAWSFSGGNSDLTTAVTFSIGQDGSLSNVRITQSSRDSAFDDSVIRAVRRAAPFPAPPEKYRAQFANGVEAVFKLGELKS